MTLLELAKRCENESRPDRELDAGIAKALGFEHGSREQVHYESRSVSYFDEVAPRFTASLDAALSLVPEGWSVGCGHLPGRIAENGKWLCRAHLRDHRRNSLTKEGHSHIYVEGHHTDMALALCAAALRARAQQESQP